jgi:hypothetical protein
MELSGNYVALLETYQKWRAEPPTYGSLMRGNMKRLAILTLSSAAIASGCHLLRAPQGEVLALGLWLGVALEESGRMRSTARAWPMICAVLDWDRVEEAVRSHRIG